MDIDIRIQPYGQSADIQFEITGGFNLKPNRTGYNGTYQDWYHDIYVTITENGFEPLTGKQKMFFRSKLKPDGTESIDTVFDLIVYPLKSETQYRVDIEMRLTDTSDNISTFTAGANFSTQIVNTKGVIKNNNEELTLKEKQKNAVYLYNKLVKTNKFALEAFCCLLGMSDCAGNINPTQYMVYKQFEVGQAEGTDIPASAYNDYNYYSQSRGDSVGYFGKFERETVAPFVYNDIVYVPQNGIANNNAMFYGLPHRDYDTVWYNYFSPWFYNMPAVQFPKYDIFFPPFIPNEDFKKSMALGIIPFDHSETIDLMCRNVDRIDFFKQNGWLTIETITEVYKYLSTTTGYWGLNAQHKQQFQKFWAKYDTLAKFAKCRNPAIKDIAEFMCYCFIDGSAQGVFGTTTSFYDPEQHTIAPLYSIECVQKKAQYWYKFFKKRKMPLWEYLRYTV